LSAGLASANLRVISSLNVLLGELNAFVFAELLQRPAPSIALPPAARSASDDGWAHGISFSCECLVL